jgi:hypothetical protein
VNLTGHISELPYSGEHFFIQHNGKRHVLIFNLGNPICVDADKENRGEKTSALFSQNFDPFSAIQGAMVGGTCGNFRIACA